VSWTYGELATEVYQLDKPIGRSFGDVEFYRERLAGVAGRVLEPAVGTGRILIPLLQAGITVDGVDTSPPMLAMCRANCAAAGLDQVLREADMRRFVDPAGYTTVIVPTGSIQLLEGRRATLEALDSFRRCLTAGGRLILDLDPPTIGDDAGPMRHWTSGDDILTLQVQHVEHDPVANRTTRWLRYERWREGALIATELQLFGLQRWGLEEFAGLLEESGFGRVSVCGGYQPGRPPGSSSWVWTFEATAP
jgi:SAM-dependent methyltransferase